ncbi:protein PLANT CADMIUM RESISTANCE 8-like [Phoenix dactylifera]|uniref:Protein PLANT CADMIUM RESISTANCE 8-like n=1 Tax=Phoenix dactylifera TaxID=42345 RepID=A0A8B9ACZ6_PHODC|nr:protein PLANT CADMIUM RESISTANCE 8-like [Phoenix dactylifera]
MGRPRPNDTEPVGQDSGHDMQSDSPPEVGSPASYPPPAVPYPPPEYPPPEPKAPSPEYPGTSPVQPNGQNIGRPWTTTLFDCGMNETNTTMTAFFPCITFGQIAEMLDEGQTSCPLDSFMFILMAPALCTCWILGSNYRLKLRNKYNLVQAPAEDWIVHLFCPFCALCQEFRELQNRGIDPSLGWMGYLAKQQETRTVPPQSQFMKA